MPETTNGPVGGWYEADDHNGHTGTGDTAEQAQEALEQAQRDNDSSAHYESLFGVIFGSGHPPEK